MGPLDIGKRKGGVSKKEKPPNPSLNARKMRKHGWCVVVTLFPVLGGGWLRLRWSAVEMASELPNCSSSLTGINELEELETRNPRIPS
ncbi:hypothetical protein RHMOL_Rhmol12G0013900 [Rhododendron molle]|uniref:Uncharacterized protein n=1 Tax=Rhododendron molle TaxID=49168 RepID=A0ACC0LEH0_RHOML|nr:hypothetical protein RHMOL_Rhmol12G0013900 [Rhododendron molle]